MPLSPEAIFKLKAVRLNLDGCVELLCNAINEASGKEALRIGCIAAIARELSSAVAAELPDESTSVAENDPSASRSPGAVQAGVLSPDEPRLEVIRHKPNLFEARLAPSSSDAAVSAQTPADEPRYWPTDKAVSAVHPPACLCASCRVGRAIADSGIECPPGDER